MSKYGWLCALVAICTFNAQALSPEELRQRIGSLVLMGFDGTRPEDEGVKNVAQAIAKGHLGGVILYRRNIESPAQLKDLTAFLQGVAGENGPIFIAVDQEGGKVARLDSRNGFDDYASPQQVAGTERAYIDAFITYKEMAAMLREHGINLNLAPVVDLRLNRNSILATKERTFSRDPDVVFEYARAFVEAHHDLDVLTTLKHWPGLGSAAADTHVDAVDVTQTWNPFERFPYERLIAEGLADAVMTAHVYHRGFDETNPATLSSSLIQGMLREKIGYEGVVMTDCLQMGAMQALVGNNTHEAALQALLAGVDVMLLSKPEIDENSFVERLALKIEAMDLSQRPVVEKRLVQSSRRVAVLKQRLGGKGPQEPEDPPHARDEL